MLVFVEKRVRHEQTLTGDVSIQSLPGSLPEIFVQIEQKDA